MNTDRLDSKEIEYTIISHLLFDPSRIDEVLDIISPHHFMNITARQIFEAMVALHIEGLKIDEISLFQEMKREGRELKAIKLAEITKYISSNIINNCYILLSLWMRKEISSLSKNIYEKSKDIINDPKDLISELNESVYKIENSLNTLTADKHLFEYFPEVIEEIKQKMEGSADEGLMSTTFPSLNRATGGIMKNDYVIIYGAYKQGKTSLAEQLMLDIAFNSKAVGMFNLEMNRKSIFYKALSMRTGIDYLKLRNPRGMQLEQSEFEEFQVKAHRQFKNTRIYVEDKIFDIDRILSKMKLWKRKYNVELFVVDYLGLIESNSNAERRDLVIAEYSRRLKNHTKILDAPIIALSQANDQNKTAESKAPARDADFVISVCKPVESGIKSIRVKGRDGYNKDFNFDETHFLITLENSRHGRNKQNIICQFNENKFIEVSIENEVYDYQNHS